MKIIIKAGASTLEVEAPREWLDSRKGWELIGGLGGDAYAAAMSGLRDADEEPDALPAVRADKAAKTER